AAGAPSGPGSGRPASSGRTGRSSRLSSAAPRWGEPSDLPVTYEFGRGGRGQAAGRPAARTSGRPVGRFGRSAAGRRDDGVAALVLLLLGRPLLLEGSGRLLLRA